MQRQTSLLLYITAHQHTKFEWGVNDCCTFSCNWFKEITGKNLLPLVGGDYNDEKGAMLLLEKFGRDNASALFGEEIHPSLATPGDIVEADMEYGETLGICLGLDSAFIGIKELITVRTLECKRAWRVN